MSQELRHVWRHVFPQQKWCTHTDFEKHVIHVWRHANRNNLWHSEQTKGKGIVKCNLSHCAALTCIGPSTSAFLAWSNVRKFYFSDMNRNLRHHRTYWTQGHPVLAEACSHLKAFRAAGKALMIAWHSRQCSFAGSSICPWLFLLIQHLRVTRRMLSELGKQSLAREAS